MPTIEIKDYKKYLALLEKVKHLPGQHSQQSHGGGSPGSLSGRAITSNNPMFTGKTLSSSDGKRKWKLHDDGKAYHVTVWDADTGDITKVKKFAYNVGKKDSKIGALKRATYAQAQEKKKYESSKK